MRIHSSVSNTLNQIVIKRWRSSFIEGRLDRLAVHPSLKETLGLSNSTLVWVISSPIRSNSRRRAFLLASRVSNFLLLAITKQRPRSWLDGWFGRFAPRALMLETIFSTTSRLGDWERKGIKKRKLWEQRKKGTTNLVDEGVRRRSHGKRKDSSKRNKGRTIVYKDWLKRSVKAFNTERWKLANKGQSQFTNYKWSLNQAQRMDGIDKI
jgi:hypothetical protein